MSSSNEIARGALADSAIHEHWVAAYRTPEAQGFYEIAFDEIARRLGAPVDAIVLDAGCGSCAKSILLAARGFRVVGTDFSADALRLAEVTVRSHGLVDRILLRQADLTNLPFANGEFSFVLCWGVLMHVPEFELALSELTRVLAPAGKLVISEGNMHSAQSVALRAVKRMLGKGRDTVVRTDAGLESHEQTDAGRLVTRQMDMRWFATECDRRGLSVRARFAGQLTELYVLAPWPWLRRFIHFVNYVWFRWIRRPGPAFGNILILEKRVV